MTRRHKMWRTMAWRLGRRASSRASAAAAAAAAAAPVAQAMASSQEASATPSRQADVAAHAHTTPSDAHMVPAWWLFPAALLGAAIMLAGNCWMH